MNIKGKIGETTNLRKRINGYKNSQHNGMQKYFDDLKSSKTVETVNRSNMTVNIIDLRLFSFVYIYFTQPIELNDK